MLRMRRSKHGERCVACQRRLWVFLHALHGRLLHSHGALLTAAAPLLPAAWLLRPGSSMIELSPFGFDEHVPSLQYPLFNYAVSSCCCCCMLRVCRCKAGC